MSNILGASFIKEMAEICDLMYRKGWNERNGGNVSYLIPESETLGYENIFSQSSNRRRRIPLESPIPELKNKIFLVTGTGKYLKNVSKNPEGNLCLLQITDDGTSYDMLWGLYGNFPTSEISSHLMCHKVRLEKDPKHRAIVHNHATNIEAMTFIEDLDDKTFSRILWKMQTESLIVFPEGVGVIPWMVCGSDAIGKVTAEKMKEYRLVVWAHHGILGAGSTLEEAFGLIETAEKAAEIYLKIASLSIKQMISDDNLRELASAFNVNYNKKFLE